MSKHIALTAFAVLWAASAAAQTPGGAARPAPAQPQTAQAVTQASGAGSSSAGCQQFAASYPTINCKSGKPVTTGSTLIFPEAYDYVPVRGQ